MCKEHESKCLSTARLTLPYVPGNQIMCNLAVPWANGVTVQVPENISLAVHMLFKKAALCGNSGNNMK